MDSQANQQPHVLLIEDQLADAEICQILLEQAGFSVTYARTLLDGESYAMLHLSAEKPMLAPTVIMLDLKMPEPSHPALEASLLAAALRGRMLAGTIRPANMVALTSHLSPEREEEALYAGCAQVLQKPLTSRHAAWLRTFVDQPPTTMHGQLDQGRRLYQAKAEEILQLVRRSQPPMEWSAEDIHLVLSAVTNYPAPDTIDANRRATLLMTLGGSGAAHEYFRKCAAQLDEPHRSLLGAFLDGRVRNQIYPLFPDYDRSTVFRHIQSLPKRLTSCFR